MLEGKRVKLRLMRESDLVDYYRLFHGSLKNRGPFWPSWPTSFIALPELKKRFQEYGFWDPAKRPSVLLIMNKSEELVGQIRWGPGLYDAFKIGWIIFDPADRGKGYATEAAQLVVRWMFDGLNINRIEAYIHPGNEVSQKIAEKCGFKHEATLSGVRFEHGEYKDLRLYRILRQEFDEQNA